MGEVGILVPVRWLQGEVPAVTGGAQQRAILEEVLDRYNDSPPSPTPTPSSLRRSRHAAYSPGIPFFISS